MNQAPNMNQAANKWINEDFIIETKDIKAPEVTATSGPQEVKVDVKYQPSSLHLLGSKDETNFI